MITSIAAIIGSVSGMAGLVLGIINYLRDRPSIRIDLLTPQVKATEGLANYPALKVQVAYSGSRKAFISRVGIEGRRFNSLQWTDIKNESKPSSLAEGDPPILVRFPLRDMPGFRRDYKAVRGFVENSTGNRFKSKRLLQKHFPGPTKAG